jgi:hypothetical protein
VAGEVRRVCEGKGRILGIFWRQNPWDFVMDWMVRKGPQES